MKLSIAGRCSTSWSLRTQLPGSAKFAARGASVRFPAPRRSLRSHRDKRHRGARDQSRAHGPCAEGPWVSPSAHGSITFKMMEAFFP